MRPSVDLLATAGPAIKSRIEEDLNSVSASVVEPVQRMFTRQFIKFFGFFAAVLLTATWAQAAWFDAAWPYRREVQLPEVDVFEGHQSCQVEFYTDGHCRADGSDIRIATEDGRLVPSHVLMMGPGDRARIVFQVSKESRDYFIYFGNETPGSDKPAPEFTPNAGLLMETRAWTGGAVHDFDSIKKSWDRSKPVLGQILIDRPFIGYNPFGDQEQWIDKMSGQLLAPLDGDYTLAMAVDDEGGFYIDGKPTLFAHLGGADIRYHTTIHLDKGWHDFELYHVNFAMGSYVSVGWRRPNGPKVEVITAQYFGTCTPATAGPLEEHGKTLVADIAITQMGECDTDNGYCFRYRFDAKAKSGLSTKFHVDLGDGFATSESQFEHVYLTPGVYTVKVTAHAGGNETSQSVQLAVDRDWARIMEVREDLPAAESELVATDDLNTLTPPQLLRALSLHLKANRLDFAVAVAEKLAAATKNADSAGTFKALLDLEQRLVESNKSESAYAIWDRVPAVSPLQPNAAMHAADLAMWTTGDFAKAAKLLQPFTSGGDDSVKRIDAQAMFLSGRTTEGEKQLQAMASRMPEARKVALSGAAARTVEFDITEREIEAGEAAWDKWMTRFPTDFLEGYSVLLRTRLMEQRSHPLAAAKLAEAFATAAPKSPYAPQLLDRASKLLAKTDPAKSESLHQLLKQKYPEDPLSQN